MLDSLQTTKRANYWLIGITLPLVALGVMFEQWYAFLIPPALFVVWLTLYRLDWAMWFVVLATPLSVTLEDLTGGSGLSVPTEPLLVLITFITLVKMFFFAEYDKRILRHPISIAIYFYLAWMGLTSITSELPLVSLKQWVSRIWFIVPYYFVLAHLFLKNDRNKEIFPLVVSSSVGLPQPSTRFTYTASMVLPKRPPLGSCFPLFKEHTSYGAVSRYVLPGRTLSGFS